MDASNFSSVSIIGLRQFSWVFIMDWVLVLVISIFMLFYFNRMVGYIITVLLRSYMWHMHRAQIKVQSIQLSLLGGRLFFKNVSYIGSNETITVVQGSFTWRYWLLKKRISAYFDSPEARNTDNVTTESPTEGTNNLAKHKTAPARFSLSIEGLEWFVYNRSAAFDLLEESLKKNESPEEDPSSPATEDPVLSQESSFTSSQESPKPIMKEKTILESLQPFAEMLTGSDDSCNNLKQPHITHGEYLFLRLLPLQLKLSKGAAILGNRTTPSLMVFHFKTGIGLIDAAKPKNAADKYKLSYQVDFQKPVIELRSNVHYDHAENTTEPNIDILNWSSYSFLSKLFSLKFLLWPFQKLWKFVSAQRKKRSSKTRNPETDARNTADRGESWRGLSRYRLNEGNDYELEDFMQQARVRLNATDPIKEYGKVSTILDASEASITFYYDAPGLIPPLTTPVVHPSTYSGADVGNNGSAPEWGVDLSFTGSTIHYGPWTDRQRIPLQHMLNPLHFHNFKPQAKSKPGELRVYTEFKMFLELKENTIVRVPLRETSKNSQYSREKSEEEEVLGNKDEEEDSSENKELRPFGWLEIKAGDMSTVSYSMSMIPTAKHGWESSVRADLINPEIRSSVNHELLFSASSHTIDADISNTLKWNELQNWMFKFNSYDVKTFFVREHVMLLSDLVIDFADGVPTPYDLFTPFIYKLDWQIHNDFGIYLNVNDLNIINNPSDFDENTYIAFKGKDLEIKATIPMDQVHQNKNTVTFSIKTSCFDLVTCAPPWHTFDTFLVSEGGGRAHEFVLDGSYTYYAKTDPGTTDTLIMDCSGSDVTFIAYGFIIRYLLKIRENYFGENIHFQTLEEFSHKESINPTTLDEAQEATTEFTYTKTENDLDVLFYVYVTNGTIVLPCNIYSAESHILLNFASFDTDVRFTNYYMDLQANISPIKGTHDVCVDHDKILNFSRAHVDFEPTIFIDGIIAHGNRLFGLPPTEPTYFCKWDFDLGSVLINGPLEIIQHLDRVGASAAYTFVDSENGLMIPEPILYDVTYLSLKVASLKVVLRLDEYALEVSTKSISLYLNDLANERYSSRITISVPFIQLCLFEFVKKNEQFEDARDLIASFETSIIITDFVQKRNFAFCREKQQQHIALHDGPFDRCSFLLDENHRVPNKRIPGNIIPSISLSIVPPALTNETMKYIDPNMGDALGMDDLDEGDSSASSRSQFSFSDSDSDSESSNSSNDQKFHDKKHALKYNFKFAGKEINGNAFLPPDSWKQFEQVASEIKEKIPNFDLNPSCYYSSEEPLCPTGQLDPQFEYDSFVIQLGDVTGFLSPQAVAGAGVLLKMSQQQDLQSAMDTIQIDVLKNLNYIRTGKPEIKNFRVSISSVDVKYGTLTGSSDIDIRQQYEGHVSHIALKCDAIAVAFRSKHFKLPEADIGKYLDNNQAKVPASISVYVGCQNLSAYIRRGRSDIDFTDSQGQIHHTDYQPLLLMLESPEFWFHEGETQNSTSLRLKNINLSIMNEHIKWVGDFIGHAITGIKKACETTDNGIVLNNYNRTRTVYVIHALSMASETFNIEEDPSVLTRPAFIIQSSNRMRSNDSWKIIVRLRHILKSVPLGWREVQDKLVQQNKFVPISSEEAKKDVFNVFSRWRSWELDNMQKSYVFSHAFDTTTLQDTLLSKSMAIVVDLECIAIRLHQMETEDFLIFDYVKLSLGWNNGDQSVDAAVAEPNPLNIDTSIGCSNIRSSISMNFLQGYARLAPFLQKVDSQPATPPASLNQSDLTASKKPEDVKPTLPPLSISATGFVQNMSSVIALPSISCALETKDIELSAFVEQLNLKELLDLGLSLAFHFQHVEFSVLEQRSDSYAVQDSETLLTFALKDYKGSVTSSGPLLSSPKYLTCSNDEVQLLLHKSLEYISKVATRVIDVDYAMLKPIIEVLDIGSDEKSVTGDTASTESGSALLDAIRFPIYVKASCNTSEIQLKFSPSWCLYLSTSQTDFNASKSEDMHCVCELKLADQEVGLLVTNSIDNEDDGVRRVTSFTLPSFLALFFLEETPDNICTEMIVNVDSFEIRTLTLTSALRLIRSEITREEIAQGIEEVKALIDKIEATFGGTNKKESSELLIQKEPEPADQSLVKVEEKSKPFCFNLNFSVSQTVVVVPSLESSLMLELENIHFIISSFYRDPQTSSFVTHPLSMDLNVEDIIFILQNDTWSVHSSTILRVHLRLLYMEAAESSGKQQIDISSDHFQVMLCQRVVEKLVEIESYIEEGLVGFEIYSSSKGGSDASTPEPVGLLEEEEKKECDFNSGFAALQEFADRTTFRVALNQMCFAWLFEEDYSDNDYANKPDAKGFLIGHESLLITTNSLHGRTLLRGVYITPTFNEHDIFHLQTDKSNAVNTAFLPQVELITVYSCQQAHPLITLKLSGDSLKISILPSIVTIFVCAAKSVSNTIESVTVMLRNRQLQQASTATPTAAQSDVPRLPPGEFPKYSLPFSFHLTIGFDGATISLWNSLDVTSSLSTRRLSFTRNFVPPEFASDSFNIPKNNSEPSLWLQAPAIDAVVEYIKGEDLQGRDILNGEIQISSSANKIYPKVMPCIVEMTKLIQGMLKQSTLPPVDAVSEESAASLSSLKNEVDLEEQFGNIIVDVRIRLARQEVMLSCEPTARVAATVAYDDFCIGLNSSEEGLRKTSYSLSVRLTNFKCSLQHIYSREVSGMISIDNIILFVTKDRSSSEKQAILVAAKISDINTDINIKQSQDLELFQDIWYPGNLFDEPPSHHQSSNALDQISPDFFRQPNESVLDGGIMQKYRRVTTTSAIPWRIDLTIANVRGTADLGQAVGQVTFYLDKFWLSSRKSSDWEQNLVLGFDEIKLVSEGRLGGLLSLRKIQLSTAIMWQGHDGVLHPVPLVQAILGVESLESRVSFDFHSFAVVSVRALHLSMFNQRDRNYILNDRLAAVGHCESIIVYATSLAASNILDLYYTLERMRQEANASYNAILRDSERPGTEHDDGTENGKANPRKRNRGRHEAFKPFEKLRTFLDFNINLVSVYIFPDSLVDMQVFTITVRGAEARYSQEIEHKEKEHDSESLSDLSVGSRSIASSSATSLVLPTEKQLVCSLDMKLTELMVALSTFRKPIARTGELVDMPIAEYVSRSREAKGGIIIGIPICDISMQTWQNYNSYNVVDYIFSSSFSGRVDVGWNLGSVSFIRGMWENHAKTFASRRETYEMRNGAASSQGFVPPSSTLEEVKDTESNSESQAGASASKDSESQLSYTPYSSLLDPSPVEVEKKNTKTSNPEIVLTAPAQEGISSSSGTKASTKEDDAKHPVYEYRPLKPPIIAQPQLRDMGEATPPIEWIGLHRKELPSLTHQAVIVSLQKMVEEVELVYRQVLGHS